MSTALLADPDENIMAYSYLIIACQDEDTFGIIEKSDSTDFSDRDARFAWKSLFKKLEPTTGAMKVQLKAKTQQIKLVDPDEDHFSSWRPVFAMQTFKIWKCK